MTGHSHHEHSGENLVAAARGALTAAGEQWTEMRGDVFEALAERHRPASAYDIAESVGARRGKRVAANSVYRILDLFVRTNLARRDCIFLICDNCGKAEHLDDDRLTGALVDAAHGAGFAEIRPVVELRGRCAACG